jgi:hypothetical protein
MSNGLTVERLQNGRVRVFDSACKWNTVYLVFDNIILCESGFDHSRYRYAVRNLLTGVRP